MSTAQKLKPNEIAGTVIQTDIWVDIWGRPEKKMTMRWDDGTEGQMPMIVIAKPADRFIVTIRPA